jgi:hypothetical protein
VDGRDKPGRDGKTGRERSLGRDIGLALLLKFALLGALYLAFFRGDQRPQIDDAAMAQHLVAPR